MLIFLSSLFFSYLLGSIPTSVIMGRLLRGVDVRKHGSGNAGATNVFRVVGRIPGIAVLVLDIVKGVIPVVFFSKLFFPDVAGINVDLELYKILLGASVISGHVWSVFLRFKGGKGVATTAGVLMALSPKVLLFCVFIWVIIFVLSRTVSLASLAAIIFLPIAALLLHKSLPLILFFAILCIMGTYKHIGNIRRLLRGEEKRLF